MVIRPLKSADIREWRDLRSRLWPAITPAENERETSDIFSHGDQWTVFVCESEGGIAGFAEARLRDYADGCDSSPVGYLEGWYVLPDSRRSGVGRRLVAAAEEWARSRGCTEMASDALLENVDGQRAHRALGYADVDRMVSFRKDLA